MVEMSYGGLAEVISGGQTGADQGGLLAAAHCNLYTGGFAPKDYKTSTGFQPLLEAFGLVNSNLDYAQRTVKNVEKADMTVVFAQDFASPGTAKTIRAVRDLGKKLVLIKLDLQAYNDHGHVVEVHQVLGLVEQIKLHQVQTLNVAGNREIDQFDQYSARKFPITTLTKQALIEAFRVLELDGMLIKKSNSW